MTMPIQQPMRRLTLADGQVVEVFGSACGAALKAREAASVTAEAYREYATAPMASRERDRAWTRYRAALDVEAFWLTLAAKESRS